MLYIYLFIEFVANSSNSLILSDAAPKSNSQIHKRATYSCMHEMKVC